MTAYFDEVSTEIREARKDGGYGLFDKIETRLVHDCTVAVELPGFSWPDLRLAVHQKVLRYGVCTLPPEAEPADFETEDEHAERLYSLNGDLHTIFHEVARRSRDGDGRLSDDPRRGVYLIAAEGEAARTRLAEITRWGPVRDEASAIGLIRHEVDAPLRIEWTGLADVVVVSFDIEAPDGRYWSVPILGRHYRFEAEALRAFLDEYARASALTRSALGLS